MWNPNGLCHGRSYLITSDAKKKYGRFSGQLDRTRIYIGHAIGMNFRMDDGALQSHPHSATLKIITYSISKVEVQRMNLSLCGGQRSVANRMFGMFSTVM